MLWFIIIKTYSIEDMRRSTSAMSSLQREIPALFKLVSSIPGVSTHILMPILEELESKASAPFVDAPPNDSAPSGTPSKITHRCHSSRAFHPATTIVLTSNHSRRSFVLRTVLAIHLFYLGSLHCTVLMVCQLLHV